MGHMRRLYNAVLYYFLMLCGLVGIMVLLTLAAVLYTPLCYFRRKRRMERPLCMNDSQLGKHSTVKTGEAELHYVASGPRDKPLMLFVHGIPESWYSWRHQILEFQNEYRIIAIDSRGMGESQRFASVDSYTIDKLSLDIKGILTKLGYSSCILVGHDWGGITAWHFAGAYPDLVDKLIILNSPELSHFHEAIFCTLIQRLKSWYMFAMQWPWLPELVLSLNDYVILPFVYNFNKKDSFVTAEELEAIKYGMSQPGTVTAMANYYRANINTPNSSRIRHAILCPTLVVWGNKDAYLTTELAQGHDRYVRDLTVHHVEGGHHFVHQHKPREVNASMREFLQGDGTRQPGISHIIS